MVVPLATGVSENDDYQRACGRRETPLQGTDSFGSLPKRIKQKVGELFAHRYLFVQRRLSPSELCWFSVNGTDRLAL
jgi:hypothetical protein